MANINPLKTKGRLLCLKTQFVRRSKYFSSGYKNQSIYAVSSTSRCLFSDKYKTHKYSVDSTYNCWMLNCWCITWPVGFKRLNKVNVKITHELRICAIKLPHRHVLVMGYVAGWGLSRRQMYARRQAFSAVKIRSALFRDFTQLRCVLWYRLFGTPYRYHLEGSVSP